MWLRSQWEVDGNDTEHDQLQWAGAMALENKSEEEMRNEVSQVGLADHQHENTK